MSRRRWTTDDPSEPGFYWAVLIEHEHDQAEDDIRCMANGLRPSRRPQPTIAELCADDACPGILVPFFVGMGEYGLQDLKVDFGQVWWLGPLREPPRVPGLPPFLPRGSSSLEEFRVPDVWPPTIDEDPVTS